MAHMARTSFMSWRLSCSCRDLPQAKELHAALGRETEISEKWLTFCRLCDAKQAAGFAGLAEPRTHQRTQEKGQVRAHNGQWCHDLRSHRSFLIQKAVHVTCKHNVFVGTPQLRASNLIFFPSLAPSELLVNLLLIYFKRLIVVIKSQALFSEYSVFLGMNTM